MYWKSCENVALDDFWDAMGRTIHSSSGEKEIEGAIVYQLVKLLVKARQRFLIRFSDQPMGFADNLLEAFTQLMLQKLQAEQNRRFAEPWKLNAKEEADACIGMTPMGPTKQVSKDRYMLGSNASNLLQKPSDIGGRHNGKSNQMGMAEQIIGNTPTQAMIDDL